MALYQQKDNLNKEKSFEYWYNKYLEQWNTQLKY
jgi:hypothetical protein